MWDRYQIKLETKNAKKLPVEGIQTESRPQDKPISEQSRLTMDEMETESAGPLGSTFHYSSFIWFILPNKKNDKWCK